MNVPTSGRLMGYDTFGNRLYDAVAFCGPDGGTYRSCGGSSVLAAEIVGTANHYVGHDYDEAAM